MPEVTRLTQFFSSRKRKSAAGIRTWILGVVSVDNGFGFLSSETPKRRGDTSSTLEAEGFLNNEA